MISFQRSREMIEEYDRLTEQAESLRGFLNSCEYVKRHCALTLIVSQKGDDAKLRTGELLTKELYEFLVDRAAHYRSEALSIKNSFKEKE